RRGARTDEYLGILRSLWAGDNDGFEGEFFSLPACTVSPTPVQTPHPPIHIGGETDAALRRVARHGQGWHTFNRAPADMAGALARLDELLAAEGRTRADCVITVCPYMLGLDEAGVEAYAEAGADAVAALVLALDAASVPALFDGLEPLIDRARRCG
ncbi:MAG TPA: LLM class flavin-dependent oxidoreductase, partial [Acidimicrobiales bacterium]|nr:LLM class flavin-dependent oxidoreductase [Acidimicrobiales bacterium]